MDAHPRFHEVADVCRWAPQRTRALFQAYLDIKYAQLFGAARAVLPSGGLGLPLVTARGARGGAHVFVPVYADERFGLATLAAIQEQAQTLGISAADDSSSAITVHLAIVEDDSTVSYYTLGDGEQSMAAALAPV
ncbi:hypothetical protein H4R18_001013 [Coemansia javaensis]|uniref:tRNA-splicing endonuclease subunit Sen15 domain-containing protein n=1 Tax=Coemansia javaensis TaxID=2761396 RepID=A0A9W8LM76_9FUNG|nr:hypothetical protein H4R18_001013 [Coemansia javaensis]